MSLLENPLDIAEVGQYAQTALKNASKWAALMAENKCSLLNNNFNWKYLLN